MIRQCQKFEIKVEIGYDMECLGFPFVQRQNDKFEAKLDMKIFGSVVGR